MQNFRHITLFTNLNIFLTFFLCSLYFHHCFSVTWQFKRGNVFSSCCHGNKWTFLAGTAVRWVRRGLVFFLFSVHHQLVPLV
uniref:Secreted protein n=1 Tax=Pyxicephalus adspersus TaxID=30357 RepID=A0AAV3AJ97_PYXAD|nr:TPA: hypothetical protein GDO54_012670 [Pyxicephalus adspersus]